MIAAVDPPAAPALAKLAARSGLFAKLATEERAAIVMTMGRARGLAPIVALEALKVETYKNDDEVVSRVELQADAVAAAIRASGRYDLVTVVHHVGAGPQTPARVWLGIMERDASSERARSRCCCLTCGLDDARAGRARPAPCRCLSGHTIPVDVPAGWSWRGSADWPLARGLAASTQDDARGQRIWASHPVACLWGKAVLEARKHFAPDVLSPFHREDVLGLQVAVDDPDVVALVEAEAGEEARNACPGCAAFVDVAPLADGHAWTCRCGCWLMLDGERRVVLPEGEDADRARAQGRRDLAARLGRRDPIVARTDRGPCALCRAPILPGQTYASWHPHRAHGDCVLEVLQDVEDVAGEGAFRCSACDGETLGEDVDGQGRCPRCARHEERANEEDRDDEPMTTPGQGTARSADSGTDPAPGVVATQRAEGPSASGDPEGADAAPPLTIEAPAGGNGAIPPAPVPPAGAPSCGVEGCEEVHASPTPDPTPASPPPSSSASTGETSSPPRTEPAGASPSGPAPAAEESAAPARAAPADGPASGAGSGETLTQALARHGITHEQAASGNPTGSLHVLRDVGGLVGRLNYVRTLDARKPAGPVTVDGVTLPDEAEARRARVLARWSVPIYVMQDDEESDAPCVYCECEIQPGDRYHDGTRGPEAAHAACVEDVAAGRDPKAVEDELDAALAGEAEELRARADVSPTDQELAAHPIEGAPAAAAGLDDASMRRARAAAWKLRARRTAKKARPCVQGCGKEIKPGEEYWDGVAPRPPGAKARGNAPEGSACLLCVAELAEGRDPRAKGVA